MSESNEIFSLLIVDDEPHARSSLQRFFHKENYHLLAVGSGAEALAVLREVRIDAALVDLKMPGMDGLQLLQEMKDSFPTVMSIMLTAHGGVRDAVDAMRLGAVDFIEKPFSPAALRTRVGQVFRIWQLKQDNRALRDELERRFSFDRLVGNSTAMLKLKQMIARVAPGEASVLIQGETGTGKELVAQAIHHHSARAKENFVPVDCASLSETVIESELFGHARGAFTGAHAATAGLIRSADKGTLFLDEIGELPLSLQAKLLRIIQERRVRPVGSSKTFAVDIRIVVATNRDLAEEVAKGAFREDLFYRVNPVVITVPPLRERREDIPLFARYFVKRFQTNVSPVRAIAPETLACLVDYRWPGNIRELENAILRAIALGLGREIVPEDLPPELQTSPPVSNTIGPAKDTLAAYEEMALRNALKMSGNNRKQAAELLAIGEATLYRKIKKYGLGTP